MVQDTHAVIAARALTALHQLLLVKVAVRFLNKLGLRHSAASL